MKKVLFFLMMFVALNSFANSTKTTNEITLNDKETPGEWTYVSSCDEEWTFTTCGTNIVNILIAEFQAILAAEAACENGDTEIEIVIH